MEEVLSSLVDILQHATGFIKGSATSFFSREFREI